MKEHELKEACAGAAIKAAQGTAVLALMPMIFVTGIIGISALTCFKTGEKVIGLAKKIKNRKQIF